MGVAAVGAPGKKSRGLVVRKIAFFDGKHGYLAIHDEVRGAIEIITTLACPGHSIRIDDGRDYPQMSVGRDGCRMLLDWSHEPKFMGRQFARDCDARFYKRRDAYEGAFERMRADAD